MHEQATPGEERLKHLRAVFAGCARDCATHLPSVLQNMSNLAALYKEVDFVIAENDSVDDTKSILRAWMKERPNVNLITLDGLAAAKDKRTDRIATARNACLDHARSGRRKEFDHYVMFDMDAVNTGSIAVEGFVAAVLFLEGACGRAGVFANQKTRYYDLWTVRHARWMPGDIWHDVETRPSWMPRQTAIVLMAHRRQIVIPPTVPPIRVRSAFGGLGIYKMRWVLDGRYEGLNADGTEVCDHVALNLHIHGRGGELYIYTGLLNDAPSEHLFNAARFDRSDGLLMRAIRVQQKIFPPWKRLYGKSW